MKIYLSQKCKDRSKQVKDFVKNMGSFFCLNVSLSFLENFKHGGIKPFSKIYGSFANCLWG